MRMVEWDEAPLDPLFGHQAGWLADEIEELGGVEIAAYAIRTSGSPVDRLLVATDLGLVDAERSEDAAGLPVLDATLLPWAAVGDVRLRWDARLDGAFRVRLRWRLEVGRPQLVIADPASHEALLALWRACVRGTAGAFAPPAEE
jgi:hypothetical protein